MEKTNASNPYKVVLLGESGVGKTCIIAQFTSGTFDANTVTSLTAQFIRKTMEFADNKNITFDIWDTAGQEKYRSLAKIFYKDAKAIVLVYDITSKDSFVQMKEYWYEQIKQQGNKDVIIAVAANKGDLYEKRVISNEEGEEFAKQIGAIFATTSAKDDSGILELFQNLGRKIMRMAIMKIIMGRQIRKIIMRITIMKIIMRPQIMKIIVMKKIVKIKIKTIN